MKELKRGETTYVSVGGSSRCRRKVLRAMKGKGYVIRRYSLDPRYGYYYAVYRPQ